MSLAYEKCPKCHKPFRVCPHDAAEADVAVEQEKLRRLIDERIRKALAKHKVECHHYTKDTA